jgi:hypothetical protein
MRMDIMGKGDAMRGQEILDARRMDAQHQNHRRLLQALKRDVIARANLHLCSPWFGRISALRDK